MNVFSDITGIIGQTPLIKLNRLTRDVGAEVFVKLESMNPGGSVKDRLSLAMIKEAEKQGLVNENTTIIEPTSGNTGIGLAMVCAARGYSLIIVMPETVSKERRSIVAAYGARVYLTPASVGMKGAIAKAEEVKAETGNAFIPMQFENLANPEIHRKTTSLEIWNDMGGDIDIFVAGVGTGGTVTGNGEVLKSKKPNIKIAAVEPKDSPVIAGGEPGSHKIQGIGAGFIPEVLNVDIIDEIIHVSNDDAFEMARQLARQEGIFCGMSSGANVFATLQLAKRAENKGKKLVTIICDTGERYLSTSLFNE